MLACGSISSSISSSSNTHEYKEVDAGVDQHVNSGSIILMCAHSRTDYQLLPCHQHSKEYL